MGVEMELYTSYFAKVKQLREKGFTNLVCVAGYAPKFYFDTPGARFMPELAPQRNWWMEWKSKFKDNLESEESIAWYAKKYRETVLANLDPNEIARELGDGAVMLCYETPDKFCHRHLIAEWLSKHTDMEVVEIQL